MKHIRNIGDAFRQLAQAMEQCSRCGQQVEKLHRINLTGRPDWLCLSCCGEEEKALQARDNSMFWTE